MAGRPYDHGIKLHMKPPEPVILQNTIRREPLTVIDMNELSPLRSLSAAAETAEPDKSG